MNTSDTLSRENDGKNAFTSFDAQTSYDLMSEKMRAHVEKEVIDIIEKGTLAYEMQTVLSLDPRQKKIDANVLLRWHFKSPAESIAFATIAQQIVERRWQMRSYVLECDLQTLDLQLFDGLSVIPYEFMPTKVLPSNYERTIEADAEDIDTGELLGTTGKLLIDFPAGAEEAEKSHTHPGARIIVSIGEGRFNSKHVPDGVLPLERGTVILMPKELPHNFAAYPDQDWTALSFHLPYAGTKEEAITFEK